VHDLVAQVLLKAELGLDGPLLEAAARLTRMKEPKATKGIAAKKNAVRTRLSR